MKGYNMKEIPLKEMIKAAMFTVILAVVAQIAIPLPFSPIIFTLSVAGVFLCGAMLRPLAAFLSVLAYILLGAIGIPVFAGFQGGVGVLVNVTGGFLFSFPCMAWVVAMILKIWKKSTFVSNTVAMVASLVVCYAMGSLWYSFVSGVSYPVSLTLTVVPFIAFDLVKVVLVAGLAVILKRRFPVF